MLTQLRLSIRWLLSIAACSILVSFDVAATAEPPQQTADRPAAAPTVQPPSGKPTGVLDPALANEQGPFLVGVEMVGGTRDLYEGDQLFLKIRSEREAYLYVFDQQPDGKLYLIYPNRLSPVKRITPGDVVSLPEADQQFRYSIGPPFGKETIKVVASKVQLENLSNPELHQKFFNPVSLEDLATTAAALRGVEPASWAESDLTFMTRAEGDRPKQQSRRYGLFVGVSRYQFDEEFQAAVKRDARPGDPVQGMNLGHATSDARDLTQMFRRVGRLNDFRMLVDEQATRANIEGAICRWLASVSQPGDSVFIFFSGHGGSTLDLSGDEKVDHFDETLLPSDCIPLPAFLEIVARLNQNPNYRGLRPRVQELIARIGDERRTEQVAAILAGETEILDDQFARWLQHLSGRQVVVILDACHSGGFATQEKGALPTAPPVEFHFLSHELVRLKGLGQTDQALLAACRAAELAEESSVFKHGILSTAILAEFEEPGRVRLEDVYHFSDALCEKYAAAVNQGRAQRQQRLMSQHPVLVNLCKDVVLLKP